MIAVCLNDLNRKRVISLNTNDCLSVMLARRVNYSCLSRCNRTLIWLSGEFSVPMSFVQLTFATCWWNEILHRHVAGKVARLKVARLKVDKTEGR